MAICNLKNRLLLLFCLISILILPETVKPVVDHATGLSVSDRQCYMDDSLEAEVTESQTLEKCAARTAKIVKL